MSEETARRLAEAKEQEAEQRTVVDALKQQCLDSIADGLPGRLDDYVKGIAHGQPDVTKQLRRDGIIALRKEVSEAADNLGAELRNSAAQIKWPTYAYGWPRHKGVTSSLFEFLYGSRVNKIDQILKSLGYKIEQHSGLHPHSLYEHEAAYGELEAQLATLTSKSNDVAAAKEADDHDTVDSLWDDTNS